MAVPPTDWQSLREIQLPRAIEETESHLTTRLEMAHKVQQNPYGRIVMSFGAMDVLMTRATVLLGPEATRPVFQAWQALFLDAVCREEAEADRNRGVLARMGLVGYGNLARCVGGALPPELADGSREAALLPWVLDNLRGHDEFDRQTLALAMLVHGTPEDALRAMKRKSAPRFMPNSTFGHDAPALVAALISVVKAGGGFDDIRDTWTDALVWFPRALATRTSDWSRLSWLSRVVYGVIGGHPAAEVAPRLIADIAALQS